MTSADTASSTGPQCECGMLSVLRVSQKDNANNGRAFYTCPLPKGSSCKFFMWADAWQKDGGGSSDRPVPPPAKRRKPNTRTAVAMASPAAASHQQAPPSTPMKLRRTDNDYLTSEDLTALQKKRETKGMDVWDAKMMMLLSTNLQLLQRAVDNNTVVQTKMLNAMLTSSARSASREKDSGSGSDTESLEDFPIATHSIKLAGDGCSQQPVDKKQ